MNRLSILLLIAITLTANIAVSATKKFSLATAEKSYKSSLARINKSYTTATRNTSTKYRKDVHGFQKKSKRAGDLEKTLAAQKEEKRFSNENSMPEEPPIDLPAELVLAQTNYSKAIDKAKLDKHKNIIALTKRFTTYLDTAKRRMVAADKIEQAIKINAVIKKIESSPTVTAAKFALADSTSEDEQPNTQNPDTAKKPPEKEFEIIRYSKTIRAKGNMSHNWTATTLRPKKGDIIKVEASGNWVGTWHKEPCGPVGYPSAHPSASKIRRDVAIKYATLILKCGSKGRIITIGKEKTFTCDTSGMAIFLDSNILPGRIHRKGCSGNIKVAFTIKREKA